MQLITLYGIKNCSTVKKARQWLDGKQIRYCFHDYKVHGLNLEQLQAWVVELGLQQLMNTRGTTWRLLPAAAKVDLNERQAIELMLQNPSLIKRPLLDLGHKRILGFNTMEYDQWLKP
jgi:arsenate reductase